MKAIAKWVGITIGLLLLIVISLPFLINVDQFRPTLQSELSSALGREVTLGNLHLKILTGEVTADDLSVAEDPAFGKPAFLRAKSLHVGAEILPFLLSRKLIVNALVIDQPEISLVQSPSGDWNFSSLGRQDQSGAGESSAPSAGMPLDLSVKLVKVNNGRLSLRRTVGHWKPLALEQVNIELRDFSAASAFPFRSPRRCVGGGAIKLDGKAGPINPTDSAMTPVSLHLNVTQLDLARSGMSDVAPDVTGLVSFDGSGESDGVTMRLEAKLKGEKMKLAKNGTPAASSARSRFRRAARSSKALGNRQQGRCTYRRRRGAPHRNLCRAGRFHGVELEARRARHAGAGAGKAAAGPGRRAALRYVAARRNRQRQFHHGRSGRPAGHQRIGGSQQNAPRRIRSSQEDGDHREAGRDQALARHGHRPTERDTGRHPRARARRI